MIHLYGDSHAHRSFKGLQLPHIDHHYAAITMFRIGRGNEIINFNSNDTNTSSILCFVYGGVDCRCHIKRQIDLGRSEDSVIEELVTKYFNTIKNNCKYYKKIIVTAVIPPTNKEEYERHNGPITHEWPFVGTDGERVRYTRKVNKMIEELCNANQYIYFNPYSYYTRDDGILKYELSDSKGHIGDTGHFLSKFNELYNAIISEVL